MTTDASYNLETLEDDMPAPIQTSLFACTDCCGLELRLLTSLCFRVVARLVVDILCRSLLLTSGKSSVMKIQANTMPQAIQAGLANFHAAGA